MDHEFRVDPDQLADHAGQFDGLADRAGQIHGELRTTLESLGSPWGDDDAGRSFAEVHSGPADETLGKLGALPGQLGDVGTRFVASARTYDDAEVTGVHELSATDQDH
jgi:hypothetical protein